MAGQILNGLERVLAENRARFRGATHGELFEIGSDAFKAAAQVFPDHQIDRDLRFAIVLIDSLKPGTDGKPKVRLYVAAERGYDSTVYGKTVDAEQCLSGQAILQQKPMYVADAQNTDLPFFELMQEKRTQSTVAIPLRAPRDKEGRIFGAFVVEGNAPTADRSDIRGHFDESIIPKLQRIVDDTRHGIYRYAEGTIDFVTGLYSRRRLESELELQCVEALRSGGNMSMIMLDVDNFKRINDLHGHREGDGVLAFVGERISAYFPNEFAARYGGEEYVIILKEPLNGAAARAEGFRASLLEESRDQHINSGISASFGVASFDQLPLWRKQLGIPEPTEADAVLQAKDDLIRLADAAMYVAKGKGAEMPFMNTYEPEPDAHKKNRVMSWVPAPGDPHDAQIRRLVKDVGEGKNVELYFRLHTTR